MALLPYSIRTNKTSLSKGRLGAAKAERAEARAQQSATPYLY
jgi:hypothetical protein